ncbi:hypothetical protein Tco_0096902 [Tanacetum coccineum]
MIKDKQSYLIKTWIKLCSDAVTKSLTPSPRSVCVVLQDTWCRVVVLSVSSPNELKSRVFPPNAIQNDYLDAYDSECDDVSTVQAVLMANLSNYGSDVISEVPHSESYHNDLDNKSVHAMRDFEQTPVVDFIENEITSDSNIIPYSQYLQETQHVAIQDTNLYEQQDSMILSVIEQMSKK